MLRVTLSRLVASSLSTPIHKYRHVRISSRGCLRVCDRNYEIQY